jgi:hypothetical protein
MTTLGRSDDVDLGGEYAIDKDWERLSEKGFAPIQLIRMCADSRDGDSSRLRAPLEALCQASIAHWASSGSAA